MTNFDMQTGDVLLEARHVKKVYDKDGKRARGTNPPVVLDDINLRIYAGEFVALLGPSGSGKSTLLRLLAGLLRPTEGEILFKDVPQYGTNPHLSIVFQSFALFPWLTVLQNVELGLAAQEVPPTQRMRRSLAAIDTIGLDGFEDAYPKELSGGMRQRVGFARALVVEPELLFMDEPFSALDVLTAANLRKELLGLWRERKMPTRAIVMVTHNIDDAVLMADRIVVLGANPGQIRVEIAGLPLHQRESTNENYTKTVDLIYRIMTSPHVDIPTLMPQEQPHPNKHAPAKPRPYQALPHVSIGDVTGLLELVHSKGDRDDLYQLGRDLQLEVDDLLPMVDAANILGFAETQEGDLVLTEIGKRFAEAGVLEEKEIFRLQALAHATMIRHIVRDLQHELSHTLPEEHFLSELQEHFSESEAWSQLETAINWGRYAELFSYQEERGVFRLEEPETANHGAA
ncbi:ABC transporter ATP-binding protein [Dictyobacter arantiisoli]|uniref:ABC transporter ATP-binding protein n=1 Tax=Dictyobacter arantiisoli TaxID=2014874 RepID=A0A5A5T9A1_9CHLR|nr:nitrate/sulfonate/bicarbonate ABC transporter ATP-binding protein [Dictyobacter arantiisoli]GCF08070.1 ABC transporter ATP-binding protein [Dictyobacter arantiisoli]